MNVFDEFACLRRRRPFAGRVERGIDLSFHGRNLAVLYSAAQNIKG
jgi:hypothetical protein